MVLGELTPLNVPHTQHLATGQYGSCLACDKPGTKQGRRLLVQVSVSADPLDHKGMRIKERDETITGNVVGAERASFSCHTAVVVALTRACLFFHGETVTY